VEIANPSVGAVGWAGQTFGPVPGSHHVFDVPQECGTQLIRLTHQGWRWPVPHDWTERPALAPPSLPLPEVVMAVAGPPPTVEVRDVLADAVESGDGPPPETPQDAPEPLTFTEPAEHPGTGVPMEAVEASPDGTESTLTVAVPDALVDMAAAAGPDGLTAGVAADVHGKQVYNLLGKLVEQGRLVKVGRGKYAHPDHAPKG
jgi:hypothetical protein